MIAQAPRASPLYPMSRAAHTGIRVVFFFLLFSLSPCRLCPDARESIGKLSARTGRGVRGSRAEALVHVQPERERRTCRCSIIWKARGRAYMRHSFFLWINGFCSARLDERMMLLLQRHTRERERALFYTAHERESRILMFYDTRAL